MPFTIRKPFFCLHISAFFKDNRGILLKSMCECVFVNVCVGKLKGWAGSDYTYGYLIGSAV